MGEREEDTKEGGGSSGSSSVDAAGPARPTTPLPATRSPGPAEAEAESRGASPTDVSASAAPDTVKDEESKSSPAQPSSAAMQAPQYYGAPPMVNQQQQQHYQQQQQQQQQQQSPDYRASVSSTSSAAKLPPIQHFEGQPMQSQPQYAQMNGAQTLMHAPPPYAPAQYAYQNGAMPPTMSSNATNGLMRFPLPPQATLDARQISGQGRHKKEIKRRTKTGCLTCRKRRIKCDEVHPACRNCQKSKRECLGYDPIFKQQPGPAPIQPAPSVTPSPPMKAGATPTLPSNHQYPVYSNQVASYIPAQQPPGQHVGAQSTDQHFAYSTSLDPALAGSEQAAINMANNHYHPRMEAARRVQSMSIEQLFDLDDIPPSYQAREVPPQSMSNEQKDVVDFYNFHYAPGLDKLFETSWYSSRGASQLISDYKLLDFVAQCMDQFKSHNPDYHAAKAVVSLDARLVWQLAVMPRVRAANGSTQDPLQQELLPRINVLEHLLTCQYLDPNRIPPPPTPSYDPSQNAKYNEFNFWHQLGRFASLRDDINSPEVQNHLNDILGAMRTILSLLENRDVLYSVAVARHIGGRMPDWNPQRDMVPPPSDPSSDAYKLHVAHHFVQTEDQRGTNQVIQRVCGMALRGWVLQKRPEQ